MHVRVTKVSDPHAYPAGWSNRRQQLLLDDFALTAEKEVTAIGG
jgi:hypothetical protein